MKNIVLIGMPGCGKTTVGQELAQRLGREFYDADAVVVEREGKSIKEMFAVSEDCFRQAESRTIAALAQKEGVVIATGGGVVTRACNLQALHQQGIVFFINRPLEEIIKDVDTTTRPLLAEGVARLYTLYKERYELYRQGADYIVGEQADFASIVPEILTLLEKEVEL